MDALVIVCSWNTNGGMVWAWMLWSSYALGTEHERYSSLRMDALVIVCSWNTNVITIWAWMLWSLYALGTRTELWFGHGCSGHRMLLERNTNVIIVWAWMLWSSYALRAAPHGSNAFPMRTDPGASPAAKESCWNHRTQGPRGCVPRKTRAHCNTVNKYQYHFQIST